jgi:hypothetical protein
LLGVTGRNYAASDTGSADDLKHSGDGL